jgi:hypothetical protein
MEERGVVPTLDDGDVEWHMSTWGFLHWALAAVHGFCLDDLELGGRTWEIRKCDRGPRMNL